MPSAPSRSSSRASGARSTGSCSSAGSRLSSDQARYELGGEPEFVALPYYRSLGPATALRAFGGAARRFWRALDDVDCVWLLGPHPFAVPFAAIAALRAPARGARGAPGLPPLHRQPPSGPAAVGARRARARGELPPAGAPQRRDRRRSRPRSPLPPRARACSRSTSPWSAEAEIVDPDADGRAYDDGRAAGAQRRPARDGEEPAAARRRARAAGRRRARWRLLVCGEGELAGDLERRLDELGVGERAELLGYVPFGERLDELYREQPRAAARLPGPRACRRCCSRASPPRPRWSPPTSGASRRPSARRRC